MKPNFVPTPEILRAMIALEDNQDFHSLMRSLDNRAGALSAWSCATEDVTQMRWIQGRVQELSEFISVFMHRKRWKTELEKQNIDKPVDTV